MSMLRHSIQVDYELRVHFTDHVFASENVVLSNVLTSDSSKRACKVLVVIDEALAQARPGLLQQIDAYFATRSDRIELVCAPVGLEGGERTKNSYFHVSEIHSHIDRYHVDRHSYVMAIGGGALLDMVGLAAATAHRGLRHVRVPTTTLSQADSGIGVKNGINAFWKKYFIW